MFRVLAAIVFSICAHPLLAQSCPAFYRFVDFGIQTDGGEMLRGGRIFRAFDAEGAHLLDLEHTICRDVRDLAKDGRGFAIPVVSRVQYTSSALPDGLVALQLFASAQEDTLALADKSGAAHRFAVARAGATTTRGEAFLCAHGEDSDSISCQVVSPYGARFAPVVYCNAAQCEVPVMVRDSQLGIRATWNRPARASSEQSMDALAGDILQTLQRIHDIIEQQI